VGARAAPTAAGAAVMTRLWAMIIRIESPCRLVITVFANGDQPPGRVALSPLIQALGLLKMS